MEHDTPIAYLSYAREAYLLFDITNVTAKFVEREGSVQRFVIVTKEEEGTIERDGMRIEVMPAWKFLLSERA